MSVRERIDDLAEKNITYLPDWCDKFLLGYVQSSGGAEKLACYGYQAAKAYLRDKYGDDKRMYADLYVLDQLVRDANVMMLTRYTRKELWRVINEEGYKRWEGVDRAVVGIGSIAGAPQGIVYNKSLCVDIIASESILSTAHPARNQMDAIFFVEEKLIGIDLKERSPWFLTHIK